jgi:acyl-CoA hydrolase
LRKRFTIIAVVLVPLALWLWLRGCAASDWQVINAPVAPGEPIVCLGDSLVAGIGAETPAGKYPDQLARLLGRRVFVVAQPGDTTEDAYKRIGEFDRFRGGLVIITLGGNDILRRIPWPRTSEALEAIFTYLQQRGAAVALTAVHGPLSSKRAKAYRRLCRRAGVLLIPNVLAGILTDPALRADPIHPNSEGYALIAERVAAAVTPLLEHTAAADSSAQ